MIRKNEIKQEEEEESLSAEYKTMPRAPCSLKMMYALTYTVARIAPLANDNKCVLSYDSQIDSRIARCLHSTTIPVSL